MNEIVDEQQKVILIDNENPEDLAMLQALYSRSAEGVEANLARVKAKGSGGFHDSYVVGYGHKSIADCGSTTLFLEGVSMLAAKAVQDWPLYSGQETSTRYIDVAKQRVLDPVGTVGSAAIQERWMTFYRESQAPVEAHVRSLYPRREGEAEGDYDRAVKARTFDILRGFLPAGVTTNLSWHTNLRQAGDHLALLKHHPLPEIRSLAQRMGVVLGVQYPHSGFDKSLASVTGVNNKDEAKRAEREAWLARVAEQETYFWYDPDPEDEELWMGFDQLSIATLSESESDLIESRPRGCVLPALLNKLGVISVEFLLDFGSFRDIQRHRSATIPMPLLRFDDGFERWYIEQLPDALQIAAWTLLEKQKFEIDNLTASGLSEEERQYYLPMGYRVPVSMTLGLPSLVYILEMRSPKWIHPTLRRQVLEMVRLFREEYPWIPVHADTDPDDWTVRRGQQTIREKA